MSKKIKKSVLENNIVPDKEEDENVERFLSSIPYGKKSVMLTDFYGVEEAKNWTFEEINSYFTRNKNRIIEDLINEKEIRDLIGVDQKTIIDLINGERTMDELVDADGSLISGGRAKTNDTEIWTAPQQTTNDYKAGATQGRRFGMFGGTAYSHGGGVHESKAVLEMVEDLIQNKVKKRGDNDVVKKTPSDINQNQIPDVNELFTDKKKASVANHTISLIDSMKNSGMDEDELAMVLNALVKNVDFHEIKDEYKKEIKNRF